jgi:hypothetical protein
MSDELTAFIDEVESMITNSSLQVGEVVGALTMISVRLACHDLPSRSQQEEML